MKISKQNNNINFTSTPLHQIKIPDINGVLIKAFISKINPKDKLDLQAIKKIEKEWPPEFIKDEICEHFIRDSKKNSILKYYCIELDKQGPLKDKIISLASSFTNHNFFNEGKLDYYLSLIKTKEDFDSLTTDRKIKNIGKIMLGKIFQDAKQENCLSLSFFAYKTSKLFYEKIFNKIGISFYEKDGDFTIKRKEFDKYIKYVKKKFNIIF